MRPHKVWQQIVEAPAGKGLACINEPLETAEMETLTVKLGGQYVTAQVEWREADE